MCDETIESSVDGLELECGADEAAGAVDVLPLALLRVPADHAGAHRLQLLHPVRHTRALLGPFESFKYI